MHESGGTHSLSRLVLCESTELSPNTTPLNLTPARSSIERTSENNTLSDDSFTCDTPPRKVKSLRNIYESCSFALNVSDPISCEEATKPEAWLNAMKEELVTNEKNHSSELVTLPEGK